MSITAITIKNFKGIKGPVRIELKPITLLFGPNSAGKSTVLHALQYAYEIFCARNFNPDRTYLGGDQINLGGFTHLVHRRDVSQSISLRLDMDLSDRDDPFSFENETMNTILGESDDYKGLWNGAIERMAEVDTAWVKVEVTWSPVDAEAFVKTYEIGINGVELAKIGVASLDATPRLDYFNPAHPLFESEDYETDREELEKSLVETNSPSVDDEEKPAQTTEKGLHPGDLVALGAAFLFPQLRPALSAYAGIRLLQNIDASSVQQFIDVDPVEMLASKGDSRLLIANADIILQGNIGDAALPSWHSILPLRLPEEGEITETHNQLNIFFLSALIVGPGKALAEDLQRMRYLGPIRAIPERTFTPQQTEDPKRMATGLAAWDSLEAVEGLREKTNKWLKQLKVGYTIEPRKLTHIAEGLLIAKLRELRDDPDGLGDSSRLLAVAEQIVGQQFPEPRLVLHDENNNIDVQLHDVGVGLSQVLPVVIEALNTKTGTVMEIEQPELHIHPKLQVELADVFIAASQTSENPVFMIETHSEHLMLRFLKRIRETAEGTLPPDVPALSPKDIGIYYVETTPEGSHFANIRVNEDGEFLDRWPSGFFEERYEELFK